MYPPLVRIFSSGDVPRLRYIAGIILGDILGLPWDIISDKRKLGKHPVINYSEENIPGSFKISPSTLLFEEGIKVRDIPVSDWKGVPVIFQADSVSDLPFDIFAASFYLVTRYEEYLDQQAGDNGGYKASSSLAFRHGFLGIPVVDIWAREFARALLRRYQNLTFRRNEYKALLTVDTDQPFAYLGKNLFSSIGGLLHDLTNHNGHASERYRIIIKGEKDPYEVFDYIAGKIEKNCADARFFFPVGGHSRFDSNPSWKNDIYRSLIQRIAVRFETGLHLSYYASGNSELVNIEAGRLEEITRKIVRVNRFHPLRFFMPESYSVILKAGITEDYSMGYPEEAGFRAGIARPFYFYNLYDESLTTLKVVPFQVMDSTLFKYKKFSPAESKEVIGNIINETRKAGGTFVSTWHNTSLLDSPDWQCWRDVFEFMLKTQVQ